MYFSAKIKSAPTEISAPKTQTPIVAKQIELIWEYIRTHNPRNLRFYQIQKIEHAKKRYNLPLQKDKNIPIHKIFDLFGMYIISQNFTFVNIYTKNLISYKSIH